MTEIRKKYLEAINTVSHRDEVLQELKKHKDE